MGVSSRVTVTVLASFCLAGCLQQQVSPEEVGLGGFPYPVDLPRQCAPVVEQHVAAYGLSDQVESITYLGDDFDLGLRTFDFNRRLYAWVDLTSCEGYVVFDMRDTCRVRRVYTRGDCQLPEQDQSQARLP